MSGNTGLLSDINYSTPRNGF